MKKRNSTYLLAALRGHFGTALPVAGVATHCRQNKRQSDGRHFYKLLTVTTAAVGAVDIYHLKG